MNWTNGLQAMFNKLEKLVIHSLYLRSRSLWAEKPPAPVLWLFAKQIACNLSKSCLLLRSDAKWVGQAWSQTMQSHMRELFPRIAHTHLGKGQRASDSWKHCCSQGRKWCSKTEGGGKVSLIKRTFLKCFQTFDPCLTGRYDAPNCVRESSGNRSATFSSTTTHRSVTFSSSTECLYCEGRKRNISRTRSQSEFMFSYWRTV